MVYYYSNTLDNPLQAAWNGSATDGMTGTAVAIMDFASARSSMPMPWGGNRTA